jgi:hypothetical protein
MMRVAAVAGTALAGALALGGVSSATPTAAASATPATAGPVRLGLGGMCLDNRLGLPTPGNPVQIWRCLGNANQQWRFWPDGSIRPATSSSVELSLNGAPNSSGQPKAVLAAVPVLGTTRGTAWSPTALRGLATVMSTGGGQLGLDYLNDPGGSTANGTQLIGSPNASDATGASEQWTPAASHYVATKATNVPDAGTTEGGYWALDTGTIINSLVWTGQGPDGNLTYDGSQAETAAFQTMPGNPQPGGTSPASIGDVLGGNLTGYYVYTLTTSHFVSSQPAASEAGFSALNPAGHAPDTFFANPGGGTYVVSHGIKSGVWAYVSATDNCGHVESMTQTDTNGAWNNSSGWSTSGNIPAYAPAGAEKWGNLAPGMQTCSSHG